MRIPSFPHRFVVRSLMLLMLVATIGIMVDSRVYAQDAAQYAVRDDSKLWVDGTSSKSDWTVHAPAVDGSFGITGTGADASIVSGDISVESAKMEGGKSTIMDRLMHDALKVKEHPTITYKLTSAERSGAADDGSIKLKTTGKLSLGGTTRDIVMEVTGTPSADGTIRFKGSHPLKMSDYGLTPPTAMFGALRTGDDVTINFDVVAAPAK